MSILKRQTTHVIALFVILCLFVLCVVNIHQNRSDEPMPVVMATLGTPLSNGAPGSIKDARANWSPSKELRLPDGFQWIDVDSHLENTVLSTADSMAVLEKFVLRYLKRLQITCPKPTRIGQKGDGGWDVCLAGPFNIVEPCLAYSFGISTDWSFDDMITDQYRCQDMAFDPSIGKSDHKRNPLLWFFNTGIGAVDAVDPRNWKLRTFPTLLAENNHLQTTVDVLKMDVEYAEWESLETMLKAPDCLRNVKQFMLEFHARETRPPKNSTADDLVGYWNVARGLDQLGFKVWRVWDNPRCVHRSKHVSTETYCYCGNIYYVNVNYFR